MFSKDPKQKAKKAILAKEAELDKRDELAEKEAEQHLSVILNMDAPAIDKYLRKIQGSLNSIDRKGKVHCYLLERAYAENTKMTPQWQVLNIALASLQEAKKSNEDLQKALKEAKNQAEEQVVITRALRKAKENNKALLFALEEAKKLKDADMITNALQEAIEANQVLQNALKNSDNNELSNALQGKAKSNQTHLDALEKAKDEEGVVLDKLVIVHQKLSIILKEQEQSVLPRDVFDISVTEMLEKRKKSGLGLYDALSLQASQKDLQAAYQTSTTLATTHDRDDFHRVYYDLGAHVRTHRDKTREERRKKMIKATNLIQEKGVTTGIRVAGLVAVGMTTGGIGLGTALLGYLVGAAAEAGYEAWLEKYYQVPEEYKKYLNGADAIVREGKIKELAELKIKREMATGPAKKLIDAQIKAAEDALIKLKENEQAAEKRGVDILIKLMTSQNKEEQEIASKFINGFNQDTNMLKKSGNEAFSQFRDNVQALLNEAQDEREKALGELNKITSLEGVDETRYKQLMYQSLAAEGAVYDIITALAESHNQLLATQRREAFYVTLADALEKKTEAIDKALSIANETTLEKTETVVSNVKEKIKELPVIDAVNSAIASAVSDLSGQAGIADAGKNLLGIAAVAKKEGIKTLLHNPTFQNKMLDMGLTATQEVASATKSLMLQDIPSIETGITQAYNYFVEHVGSAILEGIPSAHLLNDISPAGALTMCALLLYQSAHNRWYGEELRKKFLGIQAFLKEQGINNIAELDDVSKLDEDTLKKLQGMLADVIQDFPTLLPRAMNQGLDLAEKLYKAQLHRTKLLESLTQFEKFRINDDRFEKVLGPNLSLSALKNGKNIIEQLNQNTKKGGFGKLNTKKIYIVNIQESSELFAYYYNGETWDFKIKPKEAFNFAIDNSQDPKQVEEVAEFFGCQRKASPEEEVALARSSSELAKIRKEMQAQKSVRQAEQQMVYALTGLHRGITDQITTKSSLKIKDRLFELSRQQELTAILKEAGVPPEEYKENMLLIQRYVSDRKKIIDALEMVQMLDSGNFTADDKVLLEKYRNLVSNKPYEFLKEQNKDLSQELDAVKIRVLGVLQKSGIEILETEYEQAFPLMQKYLIDRKKMRNQLEEMNALEALMGLDKTEFSEEPVAGEGLAKLENKVNWLSQNLTDMSKKFEALQNSKRELQAALFKLHINLSAEEDYQKVFPLTQDYLNNRKEMIDMLKKMVELEESLGINVNIQDQESSRVRLKTYEEEQANRPYGFLEGIHEEKIKEAEGLRDFRQRLEARHQELKDIFAKVKALEESKKAFDTGLKDVGAEITGEQYKKAFSLTQKYLIDREKMVAILEAKITLERESGSILSETQKTLDNYRKAHREKSYEFLKDIAQDEHCDNLQKKVSDLRREVSQKNKELEEARKLKNIPKEADSLKKNAEKIQALPVQETTIKQPKSSGIRGWLLRVAQFFGFKQATSVSVSSVHAVDPELQKRASSVLEKHQPPQGSLSKDPTQKTAVFFSNLTPATPTDTTNPSAPPDNPPSVVKKGPGPRP